MAKSLLFVTTVNILRHKLRLSKDSSSRIVEIGLMHTTNAITLPQWLTLLKHTRRSTMVRTILHAISASILPDRLRISKHISYKRTVARGLFMRPSVLSCLWFSRIFWTVHPEFGVSRAPHLNIVFIFNCYWPCLNKAPCLNKEPRLNKVVFFSCNWPCLTKVPCLNKEPCLNRATLFKPCYLG